MAKAGAVQFLKMHLPFLYQQAVVDRLFYPRRERTSGNDERVVSVAVAPDVRVYGRLYRVTPDAPVLLFFHGNGEIASDYDSLAGLFNAMGVLLQVMDYRGYGLSEGQPSGSTLLRDAVTVFEA